MELSVVVAWIGVAGGAVGALAGLLGAWLSVFLTMRSQRRQAAREAAADLVAKASYPQILRRAVQENVLSRANLIPLLIEWMEGVSRARARLAIIAPTEVVTAGDFLWQRATDHVNALISEIEDADIRMLEVEVSQLAFALEEVAGRELGHGRRHLVRGLD